MQITYANRSYDLRDWTFAELIDAGVPLAEIDRARRRAAEARIDIAAGRARARFVSPGDLTVEEYRFARAEVQRWRDAGSPGDDVPQAVVDGANYSDISNEQSAVEIESNDDAYESYLGAIRTPRLDGKKSVAQASGDDIDAAADAAIAQLNAIQPPAP